MSSKRSLRQSTQSVPLALTGNTEADIGRRQVVGAYLLTALVIVTEKVADLEFEMILEMLA